MSAIVLSSLSHLSSQVHFSNENGNISNMKIKDFQLNSSSSIKISDIEKLPKKYKSQILQIYKRVINSDDVKKDIKRLNSNRISIKFVNNKLVYKIDGILAYKTLKDKSILDAFKKNCLSILEYLLNIGSLQEKNIKVSKADDQILKTASVDIQKISKKAFQNIEKSRTQWSLLAIWGCALRNAFIKLLNAFKVDFDVNLIPEGVDDVLGYVFGFYGILNGKEMFDDSKKIGDAEGAADGKHKVIRNILAILGGMVDFLSKLTLRLGYAITQFILSMIASSIFLFVTLYASLRYFYFYMKSAAFKNKLEDHFFNKKLSEKEQIRATLKFIKSQITISKIEGSKILDKIRYDNKNLPEEEIKKIAHEKMQNRLLTKIKKFERRVNSSIIPIISKHIDGILKDLNNAENMKLGKKIIKEVREKNLTMINENKWYAIAISLQALELALFAIIGGAAIVTIIGSIGSIISTILLTAYLYRKYLSKNEFRNNKASLDENIELIADPD